MKRELNRPPTSRDVAALAGVSQSTVSNVLTGRPGISEATRERVLQAAESIRYRPNLAARSMRTSRTGRLAIVLPMTVFNPWRLIAGATSAARDAHYVVEVLTLPGSPKARRERLQEIIESGQFEGVLTFAPISTDDPAGEARTTVLSLAEFDDDMKVTGELNDAAPIATMMERLAALGHRRFLHITGALDYRSAQNRRDAYLATIDRLGLTSLGVIEGNWTGQSGRDAIRSLPDDTPPLAVIAPSDLVATGVVRGALERGWSVPGDISVTGWDDLDTSAIQMPSLTSVSMDFEKLGKRSVQRLLAALGGQPEPPFEGGLQAIIWRESTGAPDIR